MDLSTDYMGLPLRNPLVASPIAAVVHPRRRQAAGRWRRRRDRSVLAVRGAAARAGDASHPALRLGEAGADALVLFNRFLQPDIDPEQLVVLLRVNLSSPADARPARTWIALLRGKVRASLGAASGVEVPADLARYLVAGADVVITTSALLRHGPQYATELLDGLAAWMSRKGFEDLSHVRGLLAVPSEADGAAFERAGYVTAMRAANAGAYNPW